MGVSQGSLGVAQGGQAVLLCRFAAAVELEVALTGNPDKKMLMRALARRRDNQFDNFFDRLITELFITGTAAGRHTTICT